MLDLCGKTVLVTGASGLIGSNLVKKLMEMKEIRVIACGRNQKKAEDVFSEFSAMPNFVFVECDISITLPIHERVDVIFHAAGPIAGNIINETPMDVIRPNILGILNCLDFLDMQKGKMGVDGRLVVFSSATVYGAAGREIDQCVSEGDTGHADCIDSPNAPYAESKRMVEVIALAYGKQYAVDVVIVRFSYVYGPTELVPDTAFYQFIRSAQEGKDIEFRGIGFGRRDNIYVEDAVSGVLLAAVKGRTGEIYNISSNGDNNNFAAIDELADIIAGQAEQVFGTNILVTMPSEAPHTERKAGLRLDNQKLKSLGWEVKTELSEGIEKTMRYYAHGKKHT